MHGQGQDRTADTAFNSAGVEILLIGRSAANPMYTDEVLRRAGFQVRAITPGEAPEFVNENAPVYPLIVFSDTLYPKDISEISAQLRRRNPASKLLLMMGPDSAPESSAICDAMMEGLEGPAVLIREVRRLIGLPPVEAPHDDSFARSA